MWRQNKGEGKYEKQWKGWQCKIQGEWIKLFKIQNHTTVNAHTLTNSMLQNTNPMILNNAETVQTSTIILKRVEVVLQDRRLLRGLFVGGEIYNSHFLAATMIRMPVATVLRHSLPPRRAGSCPLPRHE